MAKKDLGDKVRYRGKDHEVSARQEQSGKTSYALDEVNDGFKIPNKGWVDETDPELEL